MNNYPAGSKRIHKKSCNRTLTAEAHSAREAAQGANTKSATPPNKTKTHQPQATNTINYTAITFLADPLRKKIKLKIKS